MKKRILRNPNLDGMMEVDLDAVRIAPALLSIFKNTCEMFAQELARCYDTMPAFVGERFFYDESRDCLTFVAGTEVELFGVEAPRKWWIWAEESCSCGNMGHALGHEGREGQV